MSVATWGGGVVGSAFGHTPNLDCGDFSVKVVCHKNEIKSVENLGGRVRKMDNGPSLPGLFPTCDYNCARDEDY